MKIQFKLTFFFLIAFTLNNSISGQNVQTDSTQQTKEIYILIKHDGTELIGEVLSDDGREVLILTKNIGKVYVQKSDIQELKILTEEEKRLDRSSKQLGYMPRGVFTTRYYITNNALPNKKGDHYALLNLYGPEVHFALSDNFSLGVMTTWIGSPLALAAKYSFKTKKEKLNFSLGTIMGSSGFLWGFKYYGGLHWGTVTLGDRSKNISLSAGYIYIGRFSETFMTKGPMLSLAGIARVTKKASLFFDSMVLLEGEKKYTHYAYSSITQTYNPSVNKSTSFAFFIMPGMRFQQTDTQAFQFALAGVSFINNTGEQVSFPLPMCSWFFKF